MQTDFCPCCKEIGDSMMPSIKEYMYRYKELEDLDLEYFAANLGGFHVAFEYFVDDVPRFIIEAYKDIDTCDYEAPHFRKVGWLSHTVDRLKALGRAVDTVSKVQDIVSQHNCS